MFLFYELYIVFWIKSVIFPMQSLKFTKSLNFRSILKKKLPFIFFLNFRPKIYFFWYIWTRSFRWKHQNSKFPFQSVSYILSAIFSILPKQEMDTIGSSIIKIKAGVSHRQLVKLYPLMWLLMYYLWSDPFTWVLPLYQSWLFSKRVSRSW